MSDIWAEARYPCLANACSTSQRQNSRSQKLHKRRGLLPESEMKSEGHSKRGRLLADFFPSFCFPKIGNQESEVKIDRNTRKYFLDHVALIHLVPLVRKTEKREQTKKRTCSEDV